MIVGVDFPDKIPTISSLKSGWCQHSMAAERYGRVQTSLVVEFTNIHTRTHHKAAMYMGHTQLKSSGKITQRSKPAANNLSCARNHELISLRLTKWSPDQFA